MCGRFYVEPDIDLGPAALAAAAFAKLIAENGEIKTCEVFPGQVAAVIANDRALHASAFAMGWGFSRPGGKGLVINARSESAQNRAMFRESAAKRRCAVPVSRYFEWRERDGEKQKYAFAASGRAVTYLAGLYRLEGGRARFAVLTRAAAEGAAAIHERMPVLLREESLARWLDLQNNYAALLALSETDVEFEAV